METIAQGIIFATTVVATIVFLAKWIEWAVEKKWRKWTFFIPFALSAIYLLIH